MLAAKVFHWWLGVILFGVGILASVALLGGYVKKAVAPRFPGKRTTEYED
ncbi:MAG: hypothetical protein ACKOYG_08600 [Ilumatobacteraceae bacterium]